tara:strand:+ start:460 stop:639 length:180 start_codon:yes stop_codon:yes gene_type:complete
MKTKKPELYKFTFYGSHSCWADKVKLNQIVDKIEESLCYVDTLTQVTKVQAIKQSVEDC